MKTRMFKTALALSAAGAMLLSPAQAAVREDFSKELADMAASRDDTYFFGCMELEIGSDTLVIDEQPQPLGGAAALRDARTMLPIETVVQAAGAAVSYADDGRTTVIAGQYGERIRCTAGEHALTVNGETMALDVPAYQQDGKNYLPVRAVAEALGLEVQWAPEGETVAITAPYQTARLLVIAEQLDTDSLGVCDAIYDGAGLWAVQFDTPAQARAAAAKLAELGVEAEPDLYIPPSEMENGID